MYSQKLTKIVQMRRGKKVSNAAVKKIIGDITDPAEATRLFREHHEAKGDFIEEFIDIETKNENPSICFILNTGDNCTKFYYETHH